MEFYITTDPNWAIVEEDFQNDKMRYYETIFTLGNGYLGVRGVTEEDYRLRMPGAFVAGLFDQAKGQVTELPNLPDWITVEMELAGERFDLRSGQILDYKRTLDLRAGVLTRQVRWQSPAGRITKLSFQRFVSTYDHHLMGLIIQVIPENYAGQVKMISGLDGQVTNSGTQHFAQIEQCTFGERGIYLVQETLQSGQVVAQGVTHRVSGSIAKETFRNHSRKINYHVTFDLQAGESCSLEKLVTLYTSRDQEFAHLVCEKGVEQVQEMALEAALQVEKRSFVEHLADHQAEWSRRWEKSDVLIQGDDFAQLAVRFAIFHLIQMTAWDDPRVSVAAKALSGEGYRGHVFWDTEIFILPFFIYNYPEVAKNLLQYRYLTLPGALEKSRANNYQGAMFPWESADTGEETTPKFGGIDLETRKPIRIWCGEIEQHISADIAYAIWHYYRGTQDQEFLTKYGAEILCLTARFWNSRVEYNESAGCYEIKNVIGPDEYSEFVNNNYYTNGLVQWHLRKAVEVCRLLEKWDSYEQLAEKIGLKPAELDEWLKVADQIKLTRTADDLLVQFDGFLDLHEIDVVHYRNLAGTLPDHISWEEVNQSQVLKQADVVMLLYLLSDQFSVAEKKRNWKFYEQKTMHDSSLSAAVHSIVAAEIGEREDAYAYFSKAIRIDLGDNMGNSDAGLHAASLGGVWQAVVNGFGGVRLEDGKLKVTPVLPNKWKELQFKLTYRGQELAFHFTHDKMQVQLLGEGVGPVLLQVGDNCIELNDQQRKVIL